MSIAVVLNPKIDLRSTEVQLKEYIFKVPGGDVFVTGYLTPGLVRPTEPDGGNLRVTDNFVESTAFEVVGNNYRVK